MGVGRKNKNKERKREREGDKELFEKYAHPSYHEQKGREKKEKSNREFKKQKV